MDTHVGRYSFEPREVSSIIDDVMQMLSIKRERVSEHEQNNQESGEHNGEA